MTQTTLIRMRWVGVTEHVVGRWGRRLRKQESSRGLEDQVRDEAHRCDVKKSPLLFASESRFEVIRRLAENQRLGAGAKGLVHLGVHQVEVEVQARFRVVVPSSIDDSEPVLSAEASCLDGALQGLSRRRHGGYVDIV
jgi:hypothetical protein